MGKRTRLDSSHSSWQLTSKLGSGHTWILFCLEGSMSGLFSNVQMLKNMKPKRAPGLDYSFPSKYILENLPKKSKTHFQTIETDFQKFLGLPSSIPQTKWRKDKPAICIHYFWASFPWKGISICFESTANAIVRE